MSLIACQMCGDFIDSDNDPGCFITWNDREAVVCERCRDELEYETEEDQ